MAKKLLDEIHPGEILLEDYMKPLGITARQLAADMDVPPSRISDIVNGARPITADTALRLGLFFSMEPRQNRPAHPGVSSSRCGSLVNTQALLTFMDALASSFTSTCRQVSPALLSGMLLIPKSGLDASASQWNWSLCTVVHIVSIWIDRYDSPAS